jgi:cytochrome c556
MQSTEQVIKSRMNYDIEKIRLAYKQQMKQLQEKLEMIVQNSNSIIAQRDSSIQQLESRIASLEKTNTDNTSFQKQASEINEKMEAVNQDLYQKMDTIQKYYKAINNSLKSIYEKENDACMARSKFQEFIVCRQKANIPGLAPFSQSEQVKVEMALKVWETNLQESKKLAREAKEACLNTLSVVETTLVEFKGNDISETLEQIDIEKNKESSRKNKESIQSIIEQMNQIDLLKINELLLEPSLQHQITAQTVMKIQEKLPLVQKKVFSFELNENIEPSRFVIALMEMCTQFNEQSKASTSGPNKGAYE